MQATRTRPIDFYNIDSFLTPEQRQIRDTIRDFVDERVAPVIDAAWLEGRFPSELTKELAGLGVLAQRYLKNMAAQGSTTSRTACACKSSSVVIRVCVRSRACKVRS